MKYRNLVLRGYTGDFFVLVFQAVSIFLFVNNNPNYLYASWVLVLTLVNPIVGFSSMSMDSIIATEKETQKVKSFLLFRLRNIFVFLPILIVINFLYDSNASPWFLLLIAYFLKSFEGFAISFRGLYYRDKTISKVNMSKVLGKFGYVLGFGFFLQELESLTITLILILLWNILVFLIYDIYILKNREFIQISNFFKFNNQSFLLKKYSLLGINTFLQLIVISFPQILIEKFLSLEILSFIGIVMLFNSAFDTVYLSSINSLRKSYSELVNDQNRLNSFVKKIIFLFSMYLVLLIIVFTFIGNILFNIYNQYFSFQIEVMSLVLMGSYLFYTANVINFQYFVKREVVQIFQLFFIRALCAVIFSYYLIVEFSEYSFGLVYLSSNLVYLLYSIYRKSLKPTL